MTARTALCALAGGIALACGEAAAQRVPGADEEVRRLVVMVTCAARGVERIGAGIIAGAAAGRLYVATADHIVRPCRLTQSERGGVRVALRPRPDRPVAAAVRAESDSALDLAVLRIDNAAALGVKAEDLPFDRLGRADSLGAKDDVVSISYSRRRPWHFGDRTGPGTLDVWSHDAEKAWVKYKADSIAAGLAGGALSTDEDMLLVGMIAKDTSNRSGGDGFADGLALGIDTLLGRMRQWRLPVSLVRPSMPVTFTSVAVGDSHMCGLTAGGAAYCWGENRYGQLGTGTTGTRFRRVLGALAFRSLHAGTNHTCGLTTAGAVYCWGENKAGVAGAEPESSSVPVRVSGGLRFGSLSVGGSHACGLVEDGAAYCWGENEKGQLGDGSVRKSATPVRVAGNLRFAYVSAGGSHTCALTADGAAYCWGDNSVDAVGNGSPDQANTPAAVAGGLRFQSLSASADGHTCAITKGGAAYCWGQNDDGQLGNGESGGTVPTPAAVAGGLAFKSVSAGSSYTCAIDTSGATHCWGDNGSGQFGNRSKESNPVPVPAALGLRLVSLVPAFSVSGAELTCGMAEAGPAYCWGVPGAHQQVGSTFPDREGMTVPTLIRP